jgi:hypothetical protein
MSRASLSTFLLAALAIAGVPGLAQNPESRPIDPEAAFAMGNSPTPQTLDHCDPGVKRALVLSGGGLKGAFQAGATYHLIVHRSCDFSEIAGVSVGSLNAVILAQAQRDDNPETSLKNMAGRAEKLVKLWQNIRSSKQILKPRWPGWMWALAMRYGVFGTESMNTFDPLMHLIQTNVDMDALDRGRPVRVGSVSLWDGTANQPCVRRKAVEKTSITPREDLRTSRALNNGGITDRNTQSGLLLITKGLGVVSARLGGAIVPSPTQVPDPTLRIFARLGRHLDVMWPHPTTKIQSYLC